MAILIDEPESAEEAADILKAVAHPIRLRIIALLCERKRSVTELTQELEVEQAVVSQQLRILRMRKLVAVQRSRGYAVYSLAEPRLRRMVSCISGCVASRR